MFKLVLEKAEEPETKLPTSAGSSKKQENARKTSIFCFIDYAKAFDYVVHNKLENNRLGKTRALFKKIGDTKGIFHAKMGTVKETNAIDLIEAEDIKKIHRKTI